MKYQKKLKLLLLGRDAGATLSKPFQIGFALYGLAFHLILLPYASHTTKSGLNFKSGERIYQVKMLDVKISKSVSAEFAEI